MDKDESDADGIDWLIDKFVYGIGVANRLTAQQMRSWDDYVKELEEKKGEGDVGEAYIHDVRGCPRCGGDHEGLVFAPVDNHPELSYWAMCPVKYQPVTVNKLQTGAVEQCCVIIYGDGTDANEGKGEKGVGDGEDR